MTWLAENWGLIYGIGALATYAICALALFFGIWWFSAAKYELAGIVLGWIPGAVAAMTLAVVVALLWPVVLVGGFLWWNR